MPKSYECDAQTEWKEEDSFDAGNRLYPLGSPRVLFQNLLSSHLIVSCPWFPCACQQSGMREVRVVVKKDERCEMRDEG